MAIPKIIHFCWLSEDELPLDVQQNIVSWKKYLPDYEFVLWNKKRTEKINNSWFISAVEQRKWAFAADYVRLYALYNLGGIYLDSDVEVLKSFNPLLDKSCFLGREAARDVIEAAVLGAEPKTAWVKQCLDSYEGKTFDISRINLPEVAIPYILKQYVPKEMVLPADFFSPKNNLTGRIQVTENSYCIHHFDGSWFTPYQSRYFEIRRNYSKKYGAIIGFVLASFFALKEKISPRYNK